MFLNVLVGQLVYLRTIHTNTVRKRLVTCIPFYLLKHSSVSDKSLEPHTEQPRLTALIRAAVLIYEILIVKSEILIVIHV